MREQVKAVLEELRGDVASVEEQAAIVGLRYLGHANDRCILEAQPLLARVARERLVPAIERRLSDLLGRPVRVQIRSLRSPQRELFPLLDAGEKHTNADSTEYAGTRAATFEDFVVGPSNQFAHAAALAVARNPGRQYNPLFIYGSNGLGKTHLLKAIAHAFHEWHPQLSVHLTTADSFMAEVVHAIRTDRLPQFKARYERADALLVDDVPLLAGRERTQQEFFHVFNTLYELGRQIVLTSDKPPKDLEGIEPRLRDRFEWGLVVDIQPPDLETRIAIVQTKAQLEDLRLPYDVALVLAEHAGASIRELEGALTRLLALASLSGEEISVALAHKVVAAQNNAPEELSPRRIQETVAQFFGMRTSDLQSPRRTRNIANARHIAMYLCRTELGASFPYIGQSFGGRDHTTVMHAVDTIARRIAADPQLRGVIETLRAKLRSGGDPSTLKWKKSFR
ncbi:MAG: chromosomal replication initiator protein DnaA [Candidatus Binatia bacterium]|nr:MAG: chromosomal replication initiator protein DnaA [Candidatus Binatia bacterium]